MKEFSGKVAVVTGAAGGIGLAMAEAFAAQGMKVVLADINQQALEAAVQRMRSLGHDAGHCRTDVTSEASVMELARYAEARHGAVHLLCNNAGIGGGAADMRPLWDAEAADWKWALDVNVWGVIHGIRAFVPGMLRHGGEGLVVNTASKAGLISATGLYATTKHTVVAISESLSSQLAHSGAKIGVCVLCPGAVKTGLAANSGGQRGASAPQAQTDARPVDATPADAKPVGATPADVAGQALMDKYRRAVQQGMAGGKEPAEIAAILLDGIRSGNFYIVAGADQDGPIKARFADILARKVVDARASFPQFNRP